MMLILVLLGMYFDAVVVFVTSQTLLFRLALAILCSHKLRTPNKCIHHRNLKFWANVADKICFGRAYKFRIGILFSAMQ